MKSEDPEGRYWINRLDETSFVGASLSKKQIEKVCKAVDAMGSTKTLEPTMHEILQHLDCFCEDVTRAFLDDLDMVHDNFEPNEWKKELRRFAKRHGLKIPKKKRGLKRPRESPRGPEKKSRGGLDEYLRSLIKG